MACRKAIVFMNCPPVHLQKGYQLCIDWQHNTTVLAHSRLWSTINFFLSILTILIIPSWWKTSMQKLLTHGKHESLVTAGFAVKTKKCSFLVQFLGEEITPSDAKQFFASISYDLWNGIADDDDEEMLGEKVIFELFSCGKKCRRNFLDFQMTKEQLFVTEGTSSFLEFLGTLERLLRQLCCAKRKLQRFCWL